jgi:hypothetical protein
MFFLLAFLSVTLTNCQDKAPKDRRNEKFQTPIVSTQGNLIETKIPEQLFFVNSDRTPVFQGPAQNTAIIDSLNTFERIQAFPAPVTNFVQLTAPVNGFVSRELLFNEEEMYNYARSEIDWYNELDMSGRGLTPLEDIQSDPEGRPAYSPARSWKDDNQHRVRYIRAELLDIYTNASVKSEILGQMKKNQRVIIDSKFRPRSDWVKVVYPYQGFVNKNSLFTNEHILGRLARQILLVNKINAALGLPLIEGAPIPPEPRKQVISSRPRQNNLPPTTIIPYGSKTEIPNPPSGIKNPTKIIPYDAPRAAQQQIVEPVKTDTTPTVIERQAQLEQKLDVTPIIEPEPDFELEKVMDIPPIEVEVKRDDYPIEIFNQRLYPDSSLATGWNDFAALDKRLYEGIDSIVMLSYPENKLQVTALGALSPYYLPVEKNFTRLGIPYGASVELSKQQWPFSAGLGYNSMRAQSISTVYILESKDLYAFAKYTPLKLLKDRLELFVNAGVTGWDVGIMNTKYPEHQDYYSPESARGINYMGGAGAMYEFKKFLFGLQYQYYGTPLIILGPDLNEPETQEQLSGFIPTTQYKLYAGSNQFQIIVGYRIN